MENEEWRSVKEFENYIISSHGRVARLIISPKVKRGGHLVVKLYSGNKTYKNFFIHRLVMQAFVENIYNKPFVNHIDNNPSNNYVGNLEWCTSKENYTHSKIQGRSKLGKKQSKKVFNYVTMKVFDTIALAAKSINCSPSTLRKKLDGKAHNCTYFCYYDKSIHYRDDLRRILVNRDFFTTAKWEATFKMEKDLENTVWAGSTRNFTKKVQYGM